MKTFKEYVMSKQKVNLTEASLFDSPFLFKEMALLNPNAIKKTETAMQFIKDNDIPGVIVGGVAVSHFTEDRPLTPDVDFMTSDISLVKSILMNKGMEYEPLAAPSGDFGGIYVPDLDADFLDANIGTPVLNDYIMKTATNAKIGGQTFPVINPAVLAIMKFTTGRDKDETDAFKLLPTVSKAEFKQHLQALKSQFSKEELNNIWGYAKLMAV